MRPSSQEKKKKVGLALGGGYARGLAHIGVLEVLEREGIPIDIISGTSIGALVGALYARKKDATLIKKQASRLDWIGMTSLVDLTLPRSGFIGGKRVTNLLRRFMGDIQFQDLDIPLACVATDIISGEEVVLREGSVVEAVRASISIPIIFKVARTNGRYLVDGGLVNNVPVSVAKKMGADFIIAVDITPNKAERASYLTHNKEIKEHQHFSGNSANHLPRHLYDYSRSGRVCGRGDTSSSGPYWSRRIQPGAGVHIGRGTGCGGKRPAY